VYTCLCKCQVLLHVWLDQQDIELISTLHIANIVKIENKNWKDENTTVETTDGHNKFMRSMDRVDHMMPMIQKTHKIDKGIEVISATNGCPKQFRIV